MLQHLRANLWLLVLTVILCTVLYPLVLWGIGQAVFHDKAQGSLVDKSGRPVADESQAVGSRLIAQPFSADEYFQPRPSAVSYNAAASGASNWGANNYLLRDRVARQLGPIVKYRAGPKKDQLAAPDIESWFQKDQFQGRPGIVAQWAQAHPSVAQKWVNGDKLNMEFVANWQKNHLVEVAQWIKENPGTPEPKPDDLAVPFFISFSKAHPGMFLGTEEHTTAQGKTEKQIKLVREGTDVQGTFFDMWLQEHPSVELQEVPADMVMASGSGLDPHITLKNALYQLDRVAAKWAAETKREPGQVRKEIEELLRQKAEAPLGGLVGVDLVNVLEVNLALRNHLDKQGGVNR
ncbi:MAG TPA: potassium-transporting ATPase subunit C [Gemmataceae bacterium]|nr:potassium-transporting ATPase subunit C [Gemmataceae bacterium]